TGLVSTTTTKKKKRKVKKKKVQRIPRDSGLVTNGYYSSSLRIGSRTVNGSVYLKNKDGTFEKPPKPLKASISSLRSLNSRARACSPRYEDKPSSHGKWKDSEYDDKHDNDD